MGSNLPVLTATLVLISLGVSNWTVEGWTPTPYNLFDMSGLRYEDFFVFKDMDLFYSWRWRYLDEFFSGNGSRVLQIEQNLIERVANLVNVMSSIRIWNQGARAIQQSHENQRKYSRMAAGSRTNNTLCGLQLTQMLGQIEEFSKNVKLRAKLDYDASQEELNNLRLTEKDIRLARVLDTFGRPSSGLILGRTEYLGSFGDCETADLELESGSLTPMRYCVSKFDLEPFFNSSLANRHRKAFRAAKSIEVGICVPQSCHSYSLNQHKKLFNKLTRSQFRLSSDLYEKQPYSISEIFCLPDKTSPFRSYPSSGRLLIVVSGLWIAIVLYATFRGSVGQEANCGLPEAKTEVSERVDETKLKEIDVKKTRPELLNSTTGKKLARVLDLVSLQRAIDEFVCYNWNDQPEDRVDLNILNAVKVIAFCVIIMYQSILTEIMRSIDLPKVLGSTDGGTSLMLIMCGFMTIDIFLVIGTLVPTYYHLMKLDKESSERCKTGGRATLYSKHTLVFIATKWVRVVPLYFLVFWFIKSILPYMSYGSYWDHGLNIETSAGACRHESWISAFTLSSALKSGGKQCLPHSWPIASELYHLVIVAPIALLFWLKTTLALGIAITICGASCLYSLFQITRIRPSVYELLQRNKLYGFLELMNDPESPHTQPHTQIFSSLIGVVAGYLIYKYKIGDIKCWPKRMVGHTTKLAYSISISTFLIMPIATHIDELLPNWLPLKGHLFAYYMTVGRLLWSSSNAIILVRLTTDLRKNYWIGLAASKFWKILSKLTFPSVLVHFIFLRITVQLQTSLEHFSMLNIARTFSYILLSSLFAAIFIHLFIESPIKRFSKLLTDSFLKFGRRPVLEEKQIELTKKEA